jgi:glycine/D-amino acid oxidase-like deaminating enzyme
MTAPPQIEDAIVVGAGMVGAAVAYGLVRSGLRPCLLDQGDVAYRASRGNFGLVWVQAKGAGFYRYAEWSRRSAQRWPALAAGLAQDAGIDVELEQPGGFYFSFTDEDMRNRDATLRSIQQNVEGDYPYQMMSREEIRARIPEIGPEVVGGSYTPMDGHVHPLKTLQALLAACARRGAPLHAGQTIQHIGWDDGVFSLRTPQRVWRARKLVLAAGLGNRALAPQVGLDAPVIPIRGQNIVTERLRRFLHYPTNKVRQTGEGGVQLGDSVEDVGFDDLTTTETLATIAQRGVRTFPLLRHVKMVRAWGALRVMSPDGFPIYQESARCPGAFLVTCHSGVTLAAVHAGDIADWIAGKGRPAHLEVFSAARFTKTQAAHAA